jgi:hypothetical protein
MTLTGNIIDVQTQRPILNASVQEVTLDKSTNKLTAVGPVNPIIGASYSIEVSSLSSDQYFQFTAPGYNLYYANDLSLASSPIVHLLKNAMSKENLLLLGGGALALLALSQNKKGAVGKLTVDDVKPYLLIGGILVVTGTLKKILTSLGVFTSAATSAVNSQINNPDSYWQPSFWKKYTNFPNGTLTSAKAVQILAAIDNAFGPVSDDVAAVNAQFHQLTSQAEVSYLADIAMQASGRDLLTYLRGTGWPNDRLSDSEINSIDNYISQLPTN